MDVKKNHHLSLELPPEDCYFGEYGGYTIVTEKPENFQYAAFFLAELFPVECVKRRKVIRLSSIYPIEGRAEV